MPSPPWQCVVNFLAPLLRTPEEIREQEDQLRKQRQYQEQRMKLQSFGRVGPAGRSEVNADRLIESMFGKAEKPKPKPVPSSKCSAHAVDSSGFSQCLAPSVFPLERLPQYVDLTGQNGFPQECFCSGK